MPASVWVEKPMRAMKVKVEILFKGGALTPGPDLLCSAGIMYQEISEGNMPPGAPLTSHEANLIIAWLNEGAKNN
jgi:hypothetical protein